jgi:hypothetical protein
MIVNGFSFTTNVSGGPHFTDVPYGSTFYDFVETAYNNNIIGGYPCGGYGEPCDAQYRPYFRPGNNVTRGQMTKFAASGAVGKGWIAGLDTTNVGSSPGADFWDVPKTDAFFQHVRTLVNIGAIRYHRADGDIACTYSYTSAQCQSMGHFYNGWNATRSQVAQILHEVVYNLRPYNR